jgi:hypothetical protein
MRIFVDLQEKGSIKVGVDGEKWKGEAVELYATSGRVYFYIFILLLHLFSITFVTQCYLINIGITTTSRYPVSAPTVKPMT